MKNAEIFYSLTIEDIQNVAEESLQRNLSDEEVRKVIPFVEQQISWHDIIDDAINRVTASR